ncbi:hypothetical protein H8356DRAFT_1668429 [Neocallimastix lanati (nom. inval.)]|nr:hypothetical protein H8356DRAFT_1668429 [Neocallimastix sp. JGI-2020a]
MINIQLIVCIIIVIYFIVTTFLYYRERHNYLIYYRKNSVTFICSLCGLLFCLILPINIEFEGPCLVDVWLITLTTFGAILCSLYRIIRMLILKKKNMFSLKYGKQSSAKVRDQLAELSSFSRNDYGLETNIVDPNNYIKQLNKIIDKGMLRWFFLVPFCSISIVTLVVFLVIYLGDHIYIFEKCINITNGLFYPITFFGAIILLIMPFAHINLIKLKFKSKWNLKTEMLINTTLLGAGLIVYGLTRVYIGYSSATYFGVTLLMGIFSFIQFNTIVIPLIEIRREKKRKERKDYKSIDEFILSLENKNFLELLKEKAMENFCIENVLFWEAYYDLMLNIKEYYLKSGKKNIVLNSSIYDSGNHIHLQEEKSETIDYNENSQSVKYSLGNDITKESVLETDQFSNNNALSSNYELNDDKTSISENFNSASPIKETFIQNNNPNVSYSPSLKQGNNFLNSNENFSASFSPKTDNILLNTNNNKPSLIKNGNQNNVIQTPINQSILSNEDIKPVTDDNEKINHNSNNENNIDDIENKDISKTNKNNSNSTPNSNSDELNNNNNITNSQNRKLDNKEEIQNPINGISNPIRKEESNLSNNNSIVNSPISPTNGAHPSMSRRTSRTSNELSINRVTSIHSTKNNNNMHSQNNLNNNNEGNKNHIIDISKFEKASCLSKHSAKDNDIHPAKKKSNPGTSNNSKSLLKYIKSLTLYNYEFDPNFKPLFEQIYYLYIYKDGIAPVILSLNTLTTITNRIENEDYSYDMYQSAIEEVINILYMNIYPKIE